ncbi:N-acetylmuramoyl-L-alanine amidase [Phytoactinopolyspora alkaliphila]|uniref:N-acetylmuramoyl-L-alanine amidase n=1 Tax=Phytoactinopolyspora alkaliphila TaxID=1783498 RepID=A0A6N9YJQ7_9ACTN|nr:peptidoglycan recognition family protein [Phytoactinopolyspora alkaliphila]NED95194.1 N-acetylmuramoyl-L-alanine amidase [Phytoactinopolyspora alkaliphila]
MYRRLTHGPRARFLTAAAGLALLAPFAISPVMAADSPPDADRQAQYAAAAAEFGVPESVLLGVSYLQSRWDTNIGSPSTSGGYGPMHLTDAAHVAQLPAGGHHHGTDEDPRGDDSRESGAVTHPDVPPPDEASLETLSAAAGLTGTPEDDLRDDAAANIRGGAALLAHYQEELGAPVGGDTDPADWYGAVARYSGADTTDAARFFADEVYATLRDGAERRTDDGQLVTLAPQDSLTPDRSWLDQLGLRNVDRPDGLECPVDISCEWLPAPYELRGDGTNINSYGNHDLGNRPEQQKIEYIIIHDAEGYFGPTTELAQNKDWVSWHYTLRASDGHIAQHLKAENVGWHAGNWFVNAKSIGLEHEGFAAQGTWYTEAMYRTSAKLVRYLAEKFDIPLDREHIIGHDNIPGILPANVAGMHWDPGPYWNWGHYFDLLGAPSRSTGTPRTGLVTMNPDFGTNRPAFTGCETAGVPCPSRGSSSVILHSEPSHDAPLVNDIALRPNGSPATMHISDHGARASGGQTFAIAGHHGDWTAIWYLGQKAWFHNPPDNPAADWSRGFVVTPKAGRDSIPVYGRAYPEPEAYPEGVPVQPIVPLQYTFPAGQRYAAGPVLTGEYYRATTYDGSSPGDWTVISGDKEYVQIQFGHRVMFVDRADVDIVPAARNAPR